MEYAEGVSEVKLAILFVLATSVTSAAGQDGAAVYKQRSSVCHEASSVTRAPDRGALALTSPESIVRALESGLVREQGSALSAAEKQEVPRFITGRAVGQKADPNVGLCSSARPVFSLYGP